MTTRLIRREPISPSSQSKCVTANPTALANGLVDKYCPRRGNSHPAMMLTEANYCRVANSRHDAADHTARKQHLPHRQDVLTIAGDLGPCDGQKILMFLGSANRDPRRWTTPDAFDLTRNPSGHVDLNGNPSVRRPTRCATRSRGSAHSPRCTGQIDQAHRTRKTTPQKHIIILGIDTCPGHAVAAIFIAVVLATWASSIDAPAARLHPQPRTNVGVRAAISRTE